MVVYVYRELLSVGVVLVGMLVNLVDFVVVLFLCGDIVIFVEDF